MTEQQIDRDRLRAVADHAEQANSAVYLAPRDLLALLDQLDQAEADRDWLFRSSRLSKEERIKANTRADQAEARVSHLETAAQVLVKEALDAETLRDEHRRGRAEAESRVKAVQHLIDQADEMGEWAITCTRLQWAIDGSAPQPGA